MSPTGQHFVTFGFGDRQIRLFNFRTGKLIKKYDESLESQSEIQQNGTSATVKLDDMEFGRRLAIDREIGKTRGGQSATVNVVFDETGNFILYPTLVGIKVLNIHTNKIVRIIGKGESSRFMNISLYQGAPKKKAVVTLVCITEICKFFVQNFMCI
jgi:peptidylprolyl isomerase domain and WD repeat-containing protein 1